MIGGTKLKLLTALTSLLVLAGAVVGQSQSSAQSQTASGSGSASGSSSASQTQSQTGSGSGSGSSASQTGTSSSSAAQSTGTSTSISQGGPVKPGLWYALYTDDWEFLTSVDGILTTMYAGR